VLDDDRPGLFAAVINRGVFVPTHPVPRRSAPRPLTALKQAPLKNSRTGAGGGRQRHSARREWSGCCSVVVELGGTVSGVDRQACAGKPRHLRGRPVTSWFNRRASPHSPPAFWLGWDKTNAPPSSDSGFCAAVLGRYMRVIAEGSALTACSPPKPCPRRSRPTQTAAKKPPPQPPARPPARRAGPGRGQQGSGQQRRPSFEPRGDFQPEETNSGTHSGSREAAPPGQPHRRAPDRLATEGRPPSRRSCSGANSCCPAPANASQHQRPPPA